MKGTSQFWVCPPNKQPLPTHPTPEEEEEEEEELD